MGGGLQGTTKAQISKEQAEILAENARRRAEIKTELMSKVRDSNAIARTLINPDAPYRMDLVDRVRYAIPRIPGFESPEGIQRNMRIRNVLANRRDIKELEIKRTLHSGPFSLLPEDIIDYNLSPFLRVGGKPHYGGGLVGPPLRTDAGDRRMAQASEPIYLDDVKIPDFTKFK